MAIDGSVEAMLTSGAKKWIGLTLRKHDGNTAKKALDWNPQGKGKRGQQPVQTRRRTRTSELQAKGKTWVEANTTAKNRNR